MSPAVVTVLASVLGAVASVVVVRGAQGLAARRKGADSPMRRRAEQLGLSYRPKGDKAFARAHGALPEMRGNAKIRHIMEGSLDGNRGLIVFESMYMVYTGQGAVPVAHTFYVTEAPPWPTTSIVGRSLAGRIAHLFGARTGLMLEGEEFNRRFKVTTTHEDFAIALLSPEMQAMLGTKTTVRWRLGPGRVCMIYRGMLKRDRIEASLDRLRRFWSLVPPELEDW